jgi:hypothetical protein
MRAERRRARSRHGGMRGTLEGARRDAEGAAFDERASLRAEWLQRRPSQAEAMELGRSAGGTRAARARELLSLGAPLWDGQAAAVSPCPIPAPSAPSSPKAGSPPSASARRITPYPHPSHPPHPHLSCAQRRCICASAARRPARAARPRPPARGAGGARAGRAGVLSSSDAELQVREQWLRLLRERIAALLLRADAARAQAAAAGLGLAQAERGGPASAPVSPRGRSYATEAALRGDGEADGAGGGMAPMAPMAGAGDGFGEWCGEPVGVPRAERCRSVDAGRRGAARGRLLRVISPGGGGAADGGAGTEAAGAALQGAGPADEAGRRAGEERAGAEGGRAGRALIDALAGAVAFRGPNLRERAMADAPLKASPPPPPSY